MDKRKIIILVCSILIFCTLLLPAVKTTFVSRMLKATVTAVSFISDIRFEQSEENRYVNNSHAIIMNQACSGYRLLVINTALWLGLAFLYKVRTKLIISVLLLIPFYSLLLNISRIILSIIIISKEDAIPFAFEARYRIHEFIGLLVIFLSVLFLKLLSRRIVKNEL